MESRSTSNPNKTPDETHPTEAVVAINGEEKHGNKDAKAVSTSNWRSASLTVKTLGGAIALLSTFNDALFFLAGRVDGGKIKDFNGMTRSDELLTSAFWAQDLVPNIPYTIEGVNFYFTPTLPNNKLTCNGTTFWLSISVTGAIGDLFGAIYNVSLTSDSLIPKPLLYTIATASGFNTFLSEGTQTRNGILDLSRNRSRRNPKLSSRIISYTIGIGAFPGEVLWSYLPVAQCLNLSSPWSQGIAMALSAYGNGIGDFFYNTREQLTTYTDELIDAISTERTNRERSYFIGRLLIKTIDAGLSVYVSYLINFDLTQNLPNYNIRMKEYLPFEISGNAMYAFWLFLFVRNTLLGANYFHRLGNSFVDLFNPCCESPSTPDEKNPLIPKSPSESSRLLTNAITATTFGATAVKPETSSNDRVTQDEKAECTPPRPSICSRVSSWFGY